jgi:heme/copper-type cytochrome/quinol oxidase subunit 3
MIDTRSASSKGTFPFLVVTTVLGLFFGSLRAVLWHREVSEIPVQHFPAGNKLTYGRSLGLLYSLLGVVLLLLGSQRRKP